VISWESASGPKRRRLRTKMLRAKRSNLSLKIRKLFLLTPIPLPATERRQTRLKNLNLMILAQAFDVHNEF
jgi:hypothetical protein